MHTHADKTQENKSQSVANEIAQKQNGSESTFQFLDNRPETVAQRKLQEVMNNSPQVKQLKAFQEMANNSPQAKQAAQLQSMADNHSTQQQQPIQKKENNTGLPDNLKTGMENLSGMSLDNVKVYRNSDKPAQLQAHAYAQGTDIHLGPGQEKHLPHELGHVVQQKQGRVKPTIQMKGKIDVNDDAGLEKEADVMGAKAFNIGSEADKNVQLKSYADWASNYSHSYNISSEGIIQGVFDTPTITGDIKDNATSIRSAGGTTNEAFIINTNGEHAQIFIKFTNDAFAIEGARLAHLFDVDTPQAISISKEEIRAKITELNGDIGARLNGKDNAIAFEFVAGQKVTHATKSNLNDDSYQQIGAIAAFDMLIGKTDLFENWEPLDDEQQNYSNVIVNGPNLTDVDLSASAMTPARLAIIQEIIETPATPHKYIKTKIGGLFEMGQGETLTFLKIQRGLLGLVGQIIEAHADPVENENVRTTILQFAALSEAASTAIAVVDAAIQAETARLAGIRQEQQEAAAAARIKRDQQAAARAEHEAADGGCCYLTTACCQYFGLEDDCEYLTWLRRFRDKWLLHQSGGEEMVSEYYEKAPDLIKNINARQDKDEIYKLIFEGVKTAVQLVKNNEMESAAKFYKTMTLSLEQKFT